MLVGGMKRKRDFSAPVMRAAADKMLRAASEGDLDGMAQGYQTSEWLLEAEDEMGLCPLHLAVKHGNEMATTFLLDLGSDVSAVDERGWTALHMALDGGSPKVTHALLSHMQGMLERGALRAECLNGRTYQDGRTALHLAVERRAEGGRWVEALVGLGADVNVADRRGRSTPLHLAVQQGYLQGVKVLAAGGADLECLDKHDWSPLRLAVQKRRLEMVHVLLDAGADVQAVAVVLPNAPQHRPRERNACPKGVTALTLAAQDCSLAVARVLIERTNPSMALEGNRAALCAAADRGNAEMVRLLLERAGVDALKGVEVPLHKPVELGYMEVVRLLLAYGADINALGVTGARRGTALHAAMYSGRLPMLRLLLHCGADIGVVDDDGRTALQVARFYELAPMLSELEPWYAGTMWGYHLSRAVCSLRATEALALGYPVTAQPRCLAARVAAGTPLPQLSVLPGQHGQGQASEVMQGVQPFPHTADEERHATITYAIKQMAPDLFTELVSQLQPTH